VISIRNVPWQPDRDGRNKSGHDNHERHHPAQGGSGSRVPPVTTGAKFTKN
jgi:hypothetical protein